MLPKCKEITPETNRIFQERKRGYKKEPNGNFRTKKTEQQKHKHSLDEFNSRTEMREESVNLKTDQIPIEDKSNFNRNTKYESIPNMNNKEKKD